METFILTALVILISIAGLGVGVMLGRPPLAGSCGGIARDGACGSCDCGRAPGQAP